MILGAKRLVVTIYIQYHLCLKYEFAFGESERTSAIG